MPPPLEGDWSAASGYEAGLTLAQDAEVTAVFAANDDMAIGVIRALVEADRSVPGDVSVVGFDDIPEAAFFRPPLTTVRQDFGELGRRALRLLVDTICDHHSAGSPLPVDPELVVRSSAARPRA